MLHIVVQVNPKEGPLLGYRKTPTWMGSLCDRNPLLGENPDYSRCWVSGERITAAKCKIESCWHSREDFRNVNDSYVSKNMLLGPESKSLVLRIAREIPKLAPLLGYGVTLFCALRRLIAQGESKTHLLGYEEFFSV